MSEIESKVLDVRTQEAISQFCPFGYLDIRTAVNVSLEAGKDIDFVYECVSEFAESCSAKIDDCDPCYCVYDAILQEARNEFYDLINYDFINDASSEIYTAGNFMATSYDYKQKAIDELVEKLKENSIIINDLSDGTQWFLEQIEITQELILKK